MKTLRSLGDQADCATQLREKIRAHTARVGVVGIGYVGLPLAVEKARVGYDVIGYDRNAARVGDVNRGHSFIRDVSADDLALVVATGKLVATTGFDDLVACDIIVICVPTPLTPNRDPDISYIRSVAGELAKRLRPTQLVCLESTTYPGTTEEVLLPTLATSGLVVGKDYFLAFSPERVDPGNKRYTTRNTSKVVGGMTPVCLELASLFYQQTIQSVVPVSSPRVAEMTKVFENTFRSVNIALVNELALLCDRMKISVWEVIEAAATKPFGLMRFNPGPGVGGHCIPLDPFYLAWKARQYDFRTRFIELAGEVNALMPYYVREKVFRALNERGIAMRNARILMIGVAYKRDIEDWRESPALKIMNIVEHDGAFVDYHDPYVARIRDEHGGIRQSVALTPQAVGDADCTLIITDHAGIDWEMIVEHSAIIVDTRNATKDVPSHRERIVLL